jgi:putative transposase
MGGGVLRYRRTCPGIPLRSMGSRSSPLQILSPEIGRCKKARMQPDHGGRSPATPNERLPTLHPAQGSRSSPLHKPLRKRPAHFPTVTVGFQSIIIFLTVCTRQRKPLLANDETARLIVESWQVAAFWRVGRYVIMPDHIHLFCAPNTFPVHPLKKWIECWRNQVTRAWPHRAQVLIWQREFWDRQLRRSESYPEKWHYVVNNPVRPGYVRCADDWPYHGELNVLVWHDR